ncbi:MAG: hypothetical protein ABL907_08750 [Hyphomicrobium sp.]
MNAGLIEMGLFFGAALVLAIYELVAVRRSLRQGISSQDKPATPARGDGSAPLSPVPQRTDALHRMDVVQDP